MARGVPALDGANLTLPKNIGQGALCELIN
jgi:hypothetical protein